ncbi:hypothetical protein AB0K43_22165 [Kitasatospora sp. NPDC049258]|uniref:hypothetical protein n=1 Tax=Kitasatospora sp. NPDC049258 TaxID=3155394 RepID=UPI00343020BD
MSDVRLICAMVPVLLLLASAVGTWWVLRQERRRPSSYARHGVPVHLGDAPSQEQWRQMSANARKAADTAVSGPAESARGRE